MFIHAEAFWYEAMIETPIAEEISEQDRSRRFGEVLLVLYCTEKVDDSDPRGTARLAAAEIRKYMSKIGRKTIVLFPFAFLVSREEKGSASVAGQMGPMIAQELQGDNPFIVPFGWYKKFSITSMGHKYSVHASRVQVETDS